jgi:hypothetical protein
MGNMDNKVNGRRQGDASDLRGSDGTIIDNSRNSRGIVHYHENPTGIIGNDSCENSRGIVRNGRDNFIGIVGNDSGEVSQDDVVGCRSTLDAH